MADWPPKKNSAFTVTFPIYDADGDLVTGAGSLDSEVSKDGGTFTDVSPGEAVEIATSSGMYELALSATEMNADRVATITKSATGKTAPNVMYTVTRQLVDMAYPATSGRSLGVETDGHVHADLKEWLGVAPAALAATFVQADLVRWAAGTPNALQSGRVDGYVGAMAANVLTATAINADAITAAKVAADVHAEAADAVWDEARAGHVGGGSFGEGVASVQGNVTGSVGSVTGAVGSVTGAVGSVTGNVGGNVTGSVGSIAAGGITSGSFAAGAINAAAIAANAIEAAKINAGAITAAKFAANAITSTVLADDAITAAKLATDALTNDALAASYITEMRSLASGTSDAGGSTTTVVDAERTEADDVWIGAWILFTSGTLSGQCRLVTDFVAATDTMTFAPAVTASVGAGFTYEILPAAAVDVQSWKGQVSALQLVNTLVSGRVQSNVEGMSANVLTDTAIAANAITAAKFAANAITDAAINTAAITSDKIAANAIGASELAADAATEIADAVLSRDVDQVETTAPVHSLCTAILKGVSRIRDNAGTLEVYRTNGTTIHMSQTITTDAANDPIDELTVGT